jgi:hypothetical protein
MTHVKDLAHTRDTVNRPPGHLAWHLAASNHHQESS